MTTASQPKTIVITGASDGIGKAAARDLHAQGHNVVLVGRSSEKTKAIAKELDAPYYIADFSRLADVRTLAKALAKDYKTIDVIALNAGGIFSDRTITKDGFELTFQVNHLAHFLLVGLLMNTLIKNRASIIATSSAANFTNRLNLNDLNAEHVYSKWAVYGNAKLMNIMFVRELNRRYAKQGIASAAFHPGLVATSFSRDLSATLKKLFSARFMRLFGLKTPQEVRIRWYGSQRPNRTKSGSQANTMQSVKLLVLLRRRTTFRLQVNYGTRAKTCCSTSCSTSQALDYSEVISFLTDSS